MDAKSLQNTTYIIDTCSFVAITETYPKDVFPGVWEKVDDMIEMGIILSADDVYEELASKDDDLFAWAKQRNQIFLPLSDYIQDHAIEILDTYANLIDIKNNKSSADPFLIATAIHKAGTVVTEEDFSGGPNRSKIPDVCKYYNVECINLLEMLRRERLKL